MKSKTRLFTDKILAIVFWDWKGILRIDFFHEHRIVNAAYYY